MGRTKCNNLQRSLFSELWNGRTRLRLLGIALTDLIKEDFVQISLFDTADERKPKSKKLEKAIDELRSKYGSSTIQQSAFLQDTHVAGKSTKTKWRAKEVRRNVLKGQGIELTES